MKNKKKENMKELAEELIKACEVGGKKIVAKHEGEKAALDFQRHLDATLKAVRFFAELYDTAEDQLVWEFAEWNIKQWMQGPSHWSLLLYAQELTENVEPLIAMQEREDTNGTIQ